MRRGRIAFRYTLFGVLFGFCFPAIAIPLDANATHGSLAVADLWQALSTNQLLWWWFQSEAP